MDGTDLYRLRGRSQPDFSDLQLKTKLGLETIDEAGRSEESSTMGDTIPSFFAQTSNRLSKSLTVRSQSDDLEPPVAPPEEQITADESASSMSRWFPAADVAAAVSKFKLRDRAPSKAPTTKTRRVSLPSVPSTLSNNSSATFVSNSGSGH